jgi:predicted component of type VI protein secretion system
MKQLVAKSGPLEGNTYAITGSMLIGRDADCDIQLIDRGVSRRHAAVVEQDDGRMLVRDLVSHNGTFVREQRVQEAVLQPGDELSIGDSTFEYRIAADDDARTQELELKLVGGPATAATLSEGTEIDRAEVIARAQALKAESARAKAEAARTVPMRCCDSPLSAQARSHGWKFCPACGKTPR